MNVPNKFHLVWDGVDGRMEESPDDAFTWTRGRKGKREAQIRLISVSLTEAETAQIWT
jgi:hypothetical protein